MTAARTVAIALLGALLANCAPADELGDESAAVIVDGSPDGIGLLAFLNDGATTLVVLDDEVPLDSRAAGNLIAHRNGVDGVFGTSDDDRFDTIVEVDDVPWVGEASLDRMLAFAHARGYVPSGADVLGVFDGVTFTVAEAERTLRVVNEESDAVLRYEVPLDTRAVNAIIAARPILSMGELADVYYVGTAMLTRLRTYVAVPEEFGERSDCRGDSDCPAGLRCIGAPSDGSSEYGRCYDPTSIAGQGAQCGATSDCNDGLICAGVTVYGYGYCNPAWMEDSFTSTTLRNIPQITTFPAATSVTVTGLATVPEDIWVEVDLRHSDPHSLRIALMDPNGAEAILWDGPNQSGAFPGSFVALGQISRDDQVNGRWLLRIWNDGGRGTGNLHGWTLTLNSRWD